MVCTALASAGPTFCTAHCLYASTYDRSSRLLSAWRRVGVRLGARRTPHRSWWVPRVAPKPVNSPVQALWPILRCGGAAGKGVAKELVLMKGFMIYNSMGKHGLHLGSLAEAAAAIDGTTPLTLDHDMDVLPEAGRHLTVAELADHVDDLAGRLYAAGVRSGERITIYKAANFDAWVLAAAAE